MRRVALLSLFLLPAAASAQVAERVAASEDGYVRFTYDTKPGVEICDQGIRVNDTHTRWRSYDGIEGGRNCRTGYAEVELEVRRGTVTDVDVVQGEDERRSDAVDLGRVEPDEAARYLLSLVYRGATDAAAEDAIFPAMLADVDGAWEALLDLAEDRSVHEGVRKNALFWLGQEAAEAATEGLADVAMDVDEDQEVRNSAIFALSQRPADESIPILMDVARTGESSETRKTAMFWLAQSDDPRVVSFFEDVLLGRRNR